MVILRTKDRMHGAQQGCHFWVGQTINDGSRFAVSAFGLTTAVNYAYSGLVNWPLAAAFIVAGSVGGMAGAHAAAALAGHRGLLNSAFACLIFLTAGYMLWRVI